MMTTGLNATQIKWVALFFMTIDHLGAFGGSIPFFADNYVLLRIVGRIAAPLFLFIVAESARHTKNRGLLLLRLYFAGVFVVFFTAATNFLFGNSIGYFYPLGNIFFTFFYTVLYICIIEGIASAIKDKSTKHLLIYTLALISTCIPQLLHQTLQNSLIGTLLPSPLYIEYSPIFILMGVIFYFARYKKYQVWVFVGFWILCCIGLDLQYIRSLWTFNHFFNSIQSWMLLALPFILLYNGRRGEGQKWFFYIYYPLHKYLIFLYQALLF